MTCRSSCSAYIREGGRVVRRCWVNFQCRGVLLIWIIVGQGPVALAVGAGGGCLDIFSLICPFSPLSPTLWETARYRLKYCLEGPLNPKQPTNQLIYALASNVVNHFRIRGGRVVRRCWVNFQCRGVLQFGLQ